MGRPIEIPDEDVIEAGEALLSENKAVNATRCVFRRFRPCIPTLMRSVFRRDGAHHSDLMAPGESGLVILVCHVPLVKSGSSNRTVWLSSGCAVCAGSRP